MDMFEGVGRRLDEREGSFLNIGSHSLNGRERNVLFRNNGDGTFLDVGFVTGADRVEDGRGLSIFDYDGDGRQDLLIRNYRQPAELLHNVGPERHWLELRLVGARSNRDAIGARIRLRTADGWQMREVHAGSGYLSGQSLVQHFGLGDAAVADEVVIEWPSGGRSVLRGLAADRRHQIVEDADRPTAVSARDPARPDRTPRASRARSG
jgi:enediyne biosynthesis protein E4